MLDNLQASGTAPEEVTDVVFTHLHVDHVGWGAVGDQIMFPNATYRCHQADWDYFTERWCDGGAGEARGDGAGDGVLEPLNDVGAGL